MSRESRRLKKELRMARKQAERDARRLTGELAKREAAYNTQAANLLNEIKIMQANHGNELNSLKTGFENTIAGIVEESDKRYGDLQTQSEKRIADLSALMLQQRDDFRTQYDAQLTAFNNLNTQYGQISESYMNQREMAANAANAYVPSAISPASTPLMGDQRQDLGGRKQSDNSLSSLTILSGLGTTGNPTAGLQLA